MFALIDNLMTFSFKDWFEARHAPSVNPEIKKWIDSADHLKQTIEKLKAIMKDKEAKAKVAKPVKAEKKPEKPEEKPKKPIEDKPDKKIEPKKIEPKKDIKQREREIEKIAEKPTKVDVEKKVRDKGFRNEKRLD